MPAVACVCEKCGISFYAKDEMYIPKVKDYFRVAKKVEEPKTWEDWLMHLASNCENCRMKTPPESCYKDYDKLKGG